jgi:hypothetical protein
MNVNAIAEKEEFKVEHAPGTEKENLSIKSQHADKVVKESLMEKRTKKNVEILNPNANETAKKLMMASETENKKSTTVDNRRAGIQNSSTVDLRRSGGK